MVQDDDDYFYQPQRSGGAGLDPAIARMALAAGGMALLIIIVAFAWSGFHAGSFGPPPVINPPDVPLRVAPVTPGGLVVPGVDVPIMSGEADSNAAPQLAPQGQMPDVAQLDQAAGLNAVSAPPAPAAVPAVNAAAAPAVVANPPSPIPGLKAAVAPEVQLAAVADEGKAEAAWNDARRRAPDLLGAKSPVILPAVVNGQSVWRVRVEGFASGAAAQAFCSALAAKGDACLVPGP